MKHKMKKYAKGGPTDYASSGSSGGTKDMSFSEAFRAARAVAKREGRDPDKEIFTWKGGKYTAEVEGEKKSSTPARVTKTETTTEVESPSTTARGRPKSKLPEGYRPKVGSGRYDDPTSSYADRVFSPIKRLIGGNLFGQREVERVARGADVDTEEARRRLREAGMRGGGHVKKYAHGGTIKSSASRRADGIAQRGKTRGKFV
jgi:hypothetical protein